MCQPRAAWHSVHMHPHVVPAGRMCLIVLLHILHDLLAGRTCDEHHCMINALKLQNILSCAISSTANCLSVVRIDFLKAALDSVAMAAHTLRWVDDLVSTHDLAPWTPLQCLV